MKKLLLILLCISSETSYLFSMNEKEFIRKTAKNKDLCNKLQSDFDLYTVKNFQEITAGKENEGIIRVKMEYSDIMQQLQYSLSFHGQYDETIILNKNIKQLLTDGKTVKKKLEEYFHKTYPREQKSISFFNQITDAPYEKNAHYFSLFVPYYKYDRITVICNGIDCVIVSKTNSARENEMRQQQQQQQLYNIAYSSKKYQIKHF